MNVYRSSTTMQMDAKYKAVKQSRCMTRVITALRSPINKTVSSRCDPKPGSLTGDAVQFSVGRQPFLTGLWKGCPVYCAWLIAVGWFSSCCNCNNWRNCSTLAELDVGTPRPLGCREV